MNGAWPSCWTAALSAHGAARRGAARRGAACRSQRGRAGFESAAHLPTGSPHRTICIDLETLWTLEVRVLERRAPIEYLFDRAVTRRCWTQHATTIVNNDIAREDAVRFRHETAARWCARC